MTRLRSERGFTLIELLAVLVILGIILAIGALMIQTTVSKAKQDAFISNAYTMKEAARKYALYHRIDESPVDQVTYQELLAEGLIEKMQDPFTGELLADNNGSYVMFSEIEPITICLYAENYKICGSEDEEAPSSFSELSRDSITPN
ncbi:type II secretion system protein [Jeotgalibacillus salarius]|uniref:Type II secretion system protein n=1 Tax=Jeotgalibacillus salarius TaxID=546023 RepID=A0A4Y8LIW9_9BACL|nr:type II secretion system protein [Jeotgalibacillus salarius]TFE01022.1 type II secretion system protein [Jeotgalibacillus salarius]